MGKKGQKNKEVASAKAVVKELSPELSLEKPEIFGADFQRFESYIDECTQFNEVVKGHFDRFQKQIENANSRESAIKRKITDEVSNNTKREKEVSSVIQELQDAYERNTKKLREHHQKQISCLVEKHKIEVAKWKSKYEAIKFDKTINKVSTVVPAVVPAATHAVDTVADTVASDHGDELKKTKDELEVTKKNLDRKKDVCEYLRNEVAKYKSKVSEFESIIEKEKVKSNNHIQEIERFQRDLESKKYAIESKESEIMKLKCNMDENTKNLEMKLKELKELQQNEKKWKDKCTEFEQKHQILLLEIESIKRKNAALRLEIQRKDTEIDNSNSEKNKLKKSHEALKKVCNELERQVDSYSQKFTSASSAKKSLQQQQCSISDEMSHLKNELYLANQKSSQLYLEKEDILNKLTTKEHELKTLLTNEKNRIQNLQHELELSQDSVRRLEDKVSWLEANLEDSNGTVQRFEQYHISVNEELVKIKEEASVYISNILELQKENRELNEKLENSIAHEKALQASYQRLQTFFEVKEEEMNRKKHAFEETTSQQMKLIEYLAQQSDDKSHKRLASFFPLKTLEQKYQEAQKELVLQKARNNMLNEQLNSANEELSKQLREVEFLTCEVNDLKNLFEQ